jgi:hypothetical protein
MPYNTGVFIYILTLLGVIVWAIYETMRDAPHDMRMKIAFIISVTLLGVPFIGSGYLFGISFIVMLSAYLFMSKKVSIQVLNTILVSLLVIVIGYSSYALILVRSSAETPMDQNSPKDIFTLRSYLAREQYGSTPLIYGQTYVSEVKRENQGGACAVIMEEGTPTWTRVIKKDAKDKDRYYVSRHAMKYEYVDQLNMLFTRMHSSTPSHVEAYKEWANVEGVPVKFDRCGETITVMKPTFAENLRFFFTYQLNFMYWRYFMWNFAGRQNDIQGYGEVSNGNWISGIEFLDAMMVGPQDDMPATISDNKGHNVYYLLPFLLGLLGLLYQAYSNEKGIQTFWITFFLFFMTGIAIVLYLNQTPYQARERDYAYAGSFYAFSIWIGFGVIGLVKLLQRYKIPALTASILAIIACLLVPIQVISQNWDDHDRSGRTIATDYGANYLQSCEPNAIIFTNGDNETFPLWYNQEVEGVRTDVRVCNTAYLQTDWYINQMKRQVYESAPLPISWTPDEYVQGTRDVAYIIPMMDKPIDLKTALDFVRSDEEKFKTVPGFSQKLDYIPSDKLSYQIDSAAVMAAGVLKPSEDSLLLKEMLIELTGKEMLGKQELMILEMLQNNNWKRPMYYSITTSSDQYVNLDGYFRQTGLTYQIVPINTGETGNDIDTEKMYNNVMNKFKWGGVDKPGTYLDETALRMCRTMRMLVFNRLAEALIKEGKDAKALEVLDLGMKVLPPENVPMDHTALAFGELYYVLGQTQKAEAVYDAIATNSMRNINWYFRLTPNQLASVMTNLHRDLAVMQEILSVSKTFNPEFGAKYQPEFDAYRAAYTGVAR